VVHHVVIMAGGSGTRLWPASRSRHPKQFLNLGTEKTLFQETLFRSFALGINGKIIIVTHREQVNFILDQINAVFAADRSGFEIIVLAEPEARNTAPAVMLAARFLEAAGERESSVCVLPADHMIYPVENFKEDVNSAAGIAESGKLVTFGIEPTCPETGYGYIETGDRFKTGFLVSRFREKPDAETAREFLKQGNFFWNSGIFSFNVGVFLDEVKRYSPAIYDGFVPVNFTGYIKRTGENLFVIPSHGAVEAVYRKIPSISIDYAVMEKSRRTAMVKASFVWSDVGSWDEVSRVAEIDNGNVFTEDSKGNFVFSDMPVALVGVNDLLVIQKKGALLICRKGESQRTKSIVERIKKSGRDDLL